MKCFTNKNIIQKIVMILVIIMVFNFTVPKQVNAVADAVGGVLLEPLVDLFSGLADIGQNILEMILTGSSNMFMRFPDDEMVKEGDESDPNLVVIDEKELITYSITDLINFFNPLYQLANMIMPPYMVPVINYSPEEIFSNKIPLFDINFLDPSVEGDDERNSAIILRPVIASWYVAIRTLALVALLSVLVYLGIRILISTAATDKAKYKNMIKDWLVAVCLLFVMHYIMSFALTLCEAITDMVAPSSIGSSVNVKVTGSTPKVFSTNLIGYTRFMTQSASGAQSATFLILYIMLMIYNFRFTWTYAKRVFIMAFLTVIAPLVAVTYPIDKVGDGKAQAFDIWLKEFVFNALLQPMHLILYTILVGSAMSLAISSPIYAIVALGFITQAEKLLRKMFGFEKASGGTVGTLSTLAGMTMANKAIQSLVKGGGSGGNGKIKTKDAPGRTADIESKGKGYSDNAEKYRAMMMEKENAQGGTPQNAEQSQDKTPLEEIQGEWANNNRSDTYAQDANEAIRDVNGAEDYNDAYFSQAEENYQSAESAQKPRTAQSNTPPISSGTSTGETSGATVTPTIKKNIPSRRERVKQAISKPAKLGGRIAYSGAKTAVKGLAAGTTGAVIGAATLAATGDLSQAFSAGAGAAAGVGSLIGKGMNKIDKEFGTSGSIKDTFNEVRSKSSIQVQNEKSDKAFRQDKNTLEHMEHYYDPKERAGKMEQYANIRKTGETDLGVMRKAAKLQDEKKLTDAEVRDIVKLDKKINPKVFTDDKIHADAVDELQNQYKDIADENLRKFIAEEELKNLKEFRRL